MKTTMIRKEDDGMCKVFMTVCLVCMCLFAFSQKNKQKGDTVSIMREFMALCNGYKKMPLHLAVQHSNSTTFVMSPEDTAVFQADFYLTEKGAYVRYGNMEQIITDSIVLMVSQDQHVMMLNSNPQSNMQTQLSNYLGLQIADSSVHKMADKYASSYLPGDSQKGIIELKSRSPLLGTDIVKEIITMKYDQVTREPEQVTYTRRTLIPVDKAEWDSLPGHENFADKLVEVKGHYFLVNERRNVFDYKKIDHSNNVGLPVSMTDRVTRNGQGEFIPAKGFEAYYLSVD
jgi:hypothetical protein